MTDQDLPERLERLQKRFKCQVCDQTFDTEKEGIRHNCQTLNPEQEKLQV